MENVVIKLTIGNSTSLIEGLNDEQFRSLREVMAYSPDPASSYFAGYKSQKKYLLNKRGFFPSGLMGRFDAWFDTAGIDLAYVQVVDKRIKPTAKALFTLNLNLTPYEEQQSAVAMARLSKRGTLSLCTGFGKSLTMALLVNKLQVKTLIVVPNLGLKHQLRASFKEWFGETSNITIENIDSSALKKHNDYDLLIIDEAHHVAARTYRQLNVKYWDNIYYRFFFTATPYRSQEEEQILFESIAGDVIYSVDYHKGVEMGAIVPVEAYYLDVPKQKVKGETWPAVYSELVVNNKVRNELIAAAVLGLHRQGKSTLCLVKEIAHGNKLQDLTGGAWAHGQGEDCQELINWFSDGKLSTLIATTGVCGEGVDTRPAEYVIIAGLGKSKNQFMQQVGRGVRNCGDKQSCKVILFNDRSHKWTRAHFRAQCKILADEYGVIPVKLEL